MIPETSLDIAYLYGVINEGAEVESEVFWQEKIESGLKTKRGKAIKIRVRVKPEKIYVDEKIESIRITGEVTAASRDEIVGKRLGLDLRRSEECVVIVKEPLKGIHKLGSPESLIVAIVDITGLIVARVNDKIDVIQERYHTTEEILSEKGEVDEDIETLNRIFREDSSIKVLAYNTGTKRIAKKVKGVDIYLEGAYEPNVTGILNVLTKLAQERIIENEVVKGLTYYSMLSDGRYTGKIIYGKEVLEYISYRGLRTVIITKKTVLREGLISMIKNLVDSCLQVEIVDDNSSIGLMVTNFGGLVGITY